MGIPSLIHVIGACTRTSLNRKNLMTPKTAHTLSAPTQKNENVGKFAQSTQKFDTKINDTKT